MKQFLFVIVLLTLILSVSVISCNKDDDIDDKKIINDTIAPTVPQNLRAISVDSASVTLAWGESTDESPLSGYYLYQDGKKVGSTIKDTTTVVEDLKTITAYTFEVTAFDIYNNESDRSVALMVTTASLSKYKNDKVPPTTPTNFMATDVFSSSVDLNWTESTDDIAMAGYKIYKGNKIELLGTTSKTNYTLEGLLPQTEYALTIAAIDSAGNESNLSNLVTITTKKAVPTGLNLPAGIKNGDNVSWDEANATFTFLNSVHFSAMDNADNDQEGFYWEVPQKVKKVVIGANVTITGGIRFIYDLTIEGEDRETSRIYGTNTTSWALGPDKENDSECGNRAGDDRAHDCEKWTYGGISAFSATQKTAVCTVKSITVENPRTYAITSLDQKFVIDNVHILNSREGNDYRSNSDGIGGGTGTIITNTKIDTWDDAIKLYRDMTVKNVTIIHNANGAPFQLGWGGKSATYHTIENVKIISAASGPEKHNLAPISASLTSGSVNATLKIQGKGLTIDVTERPGLKTRYNDPLPHVWLKSADATVTFEIVDNAPVSMKAPAATEGPGTVNVVNFCGKTELQAVVECNTDGGIATGAPF